MTNAISSLDNFKKYYNNLKSFDQYMNQLCSEYKDSGVDSNTINSLGQELGTTASSLLGLFTNDSVQFTAADGTVVTKSYIKNIENEIGQEIGSLASTWYQNHAPYGGGMDIGTSIAINNALSASINMNLFQATRITQNTQNTANNYTIADEDTSTDYDAEADDNTQTSNVFATSGSPSQVSASQENTSDISSSDAEAINTRMTALDGTSDSSYRDGLAATMNNTSDKSFIQQVKDEYHGSWLQSLVKAIGLSNPLTFLASTAAEAGYDYATQDGSSARQSLAETFGSDLKYNLRSALNVIPGLGDLIFGSDTPSASTVSQNTGITSAPINIDTPNFISVAINNLPSLNVDSSIDNISNASVPGASANAFAGSNAQESTGVKIAAPENSYNYVSSYENKLEDLRSEVIMAGIDTSNVNMHSVYDMQEALNENYNSKLGYSGYFKSDYKNYKQNQDLIYA